ncbi:MAG: hypothetical protein H7A32_04900 [Deltaproteobacteria bacterium]|nr:hypothetical protein [Deltaproteobacteria bacterium]
MGIHHKNIHGFILTPLANNEGCSSKKAHPKLVSNSEEKNSKNASQQRQQKLKQDHQKLQNLQKNLHKKEEWNTDITGEWGTHWDAVRATNFQSKNTYLNSFLRGVNNTAGAGAVIVNYVNTAAGTLFFDLPAKIEEKSIKSGGPSFEELAIASQASSPAMPIDDAASFTVSKLANFSKQMRRVHKLRKLKLDHLKISDKVADMIDMGISREAKFNSVQLQKKFKHATDLGVKGNFNKTNLENFKKNIVSHLNDPEVIPIRGTHRKTQSILHFYHPETKVNLMLDTEHNFISGWKLFPNQDHSLLTTGNIQ